jgi:ketosteroid isomerase-like protein
MVDRTAPGVLDVLERRREAVLARDMAAFADLFAPDAVIEMPFGAGGMPTRLTGQDEIRAFSTRSGGARVELTDLRTSAVHRTLDPEVVIVELRSIGRVVGTGEEFDVPCIQVFRIRDGRILLFRDYVSTTAMPDLGAA